MNKKILIGSIIAICLLVGVSFTSVVGYRSVSSDVKASPLFNIRSSRAIDEESHDITYDYIRKGNTFPIPRRDGKTAIIDTLIGIINKMDESTYNRFVRRVFTDYNVDSKDVNEIFQLIRNNQKNLKQNSTRDEPLPSVITHCHENCQLITIEGGLGSCLIYLLKKLAENPYLIFAIINYILIDLSMAIILYLIHPTVIIRCK